MVGIKYYLVSVCEYTRNAAFQIPQLFRAHSDRYYYSIYQTKLKYQKSISDFIFDRVSSVLLAHREPTPFYYLDYPSFFKTEQHFFWEKWHRGNGSNVQCLRFGFKVRWIYQFSHLGVRRSGGLGNSTPDSAVQVQRFSTKLIPLFIVRNENVFIVLLIFKK